MKTRFHPKHFILVPLALTAFVGVFGYVVYALWNGILPDVLGVKPITYWQALGLLVLSKILFGGFPGRRGGGFNGRMRERLLARKWESLSPEQREQLREKMDRCGEDWCAPWRRSDKPGTDPERS